MEGSRIEGKTPAKRLCHPLGQGSATFLVPGTSFVEDNFSMDQGRVVVVSG